MQALVLLLPFLAFAVAQGPLQIHVIAHTHDDVGWLKTVDEYYYGANNTIQDARVQYILDTVVQCLLDNPDRRFIYVEIAYFIRWWNEQTDYMKSIVRDLVQSGRLEFINGGWCMNDEANVHYEATIDQLTEGHQFLFQEFGIVPRVGWQIDPFGHASEFANLLSQIGFDGLFFARIDYQDYAVRSAAKTLEFVWRPTRSFGSATQIWTHSMWEATYCFAPGTAFEWGDPPVQWDPRLFNVNIKQLADAFAAQMHSRATNYATNDLLVTFGCDFAYSNAQINFKNMDYLMAYINNNSATYNMNVFYSTPSLYLDAIAEKNLTWTLKTDDFFPYADNPHSYWSGYFTSRQALKGYERTTSSWLHAAEKLFTLSVPFLHTVNQTVALAQIDTLAAAHGVVQHHDGVSGTEKQHVANDYALRLNIGQNAVFQTMSGVFSDIVTPQGHSAPSFTFCPLLNVSYCPPTTGLTTNQFLPVIVYNHLPWTRTEYVRFPIPATLSVRVFDSNDQPVTAQVFPNIDYANRNDVVFLARVPPMGFTTYLIATSASSSGSSMYTEHVPEEVARPGADMVVQNDVYTVTVSASTNRISSVVYRPTNQSVPLDQNIVWYNASAGNNVLSNQPSGAYIFRPNSSTPFPVFPNPNPAQVSTVQGSLVQEVRQVWNDWLQQTIRLYNNTDYVEVETTIQPIPINDGLGKELIVRYTTNFATNSLFWTDSMGQEFQQRQRNYRPTWNLTWTNEPVACNYFPMNTAGFIRDSNQKLQFSLVTDRSRGVSSLTDGQFEAMLQRRLLYDDFRGVGEPLNETVPVRTTTSFLLTPLSSWAGPVRTRVTQLNNPLMLFFGPPQPDASWLKTYTTDFTPLTGDLPPNVNLITLRTLPNGLVLLRLSHLYAVGDDPTLSVPVSVNLGALFRNLIITSIVEMQLTGVRPWSEVSRIQWRTTQPDNPPRLHQPLEGLTVTLQPLEIRTFLVQFQNA